MRKIILFLVVVFAATNSYSQCACCASAGVSASNGNYSNGTLTLPKKQIVVEGYSDYQTIKQGNTPEGEEKLLKNMFISSLGARYGITNKLTVSVLLPYVFLHTNSGNDKGLGDLTLMGTYNIYSKNDFNLAVQAGVELPTGIQKNSNFDNTTVIVGSGSYDPMGGIVFSKKWGELTLQGSGLFKRTTNGFHGNYYGNLSVQNISLSYRIMGENDFCSLDTSTKMKGSKMGLSLSAGYYGEWLDKIREDNIVDDNSGHYLGFANLGGVLSYKKWGFPLTVSLPIINNMNGQQNDAGVRLRVGIIKAF